MRFCNSGQACFYGFFSELKTPAKCDRLVPLGTLAFLENQLEQSISFTLIASDSSTQLE